MSTDLKLPATACFFQKILYFCGNIDNGLLPLLLLIQSRVFSFSVFAIPAAFLANFFKLVSELFYAGHLISRIGATYFEADCIKKSEPAAFTGLAANYQIRFAKEAKVTCFFKPTGLTNSHVRSENKVIASY